jgi:hypothetical protein
MESVQSKEERQVRNQRFPHQISFSSATAERAGDVVPSSRYGAKVKSRSLPVLKISLRLHAGISWLETPTDELLRELPWIHDAWGGVRCRRRERGNDVKPYDYIWLTDGVRRDAQLEPGALEIGLRLIVCEDGSFVLYTTKLVDPVETDEGFNHTAIDGNLIEGEGIEELQTAVGIAAAELERLARTNGQVAA